MIIIFNFWCFLIMILIGLSFLQPVFSRTISLVVIESLLRLASLSLDSWLLYNASCGRCSSRYSRSIINSSFVFYSRTVFVVAIWAMAWRGFSRHPIFEFWCLTYREHVYALIKIYTACRVSRTRNHIPYTSSSRMVVASLPQHNVRRSSRWIIVSP